MHKHYLFQLAFLVLLLSVEIPIAISDLATVSANDNTLNQPSIEIEAKSNLLPPPPSLSSIHSISAYEAKNPDRFGNPLPKESLLSLMNIAFVIGILFAISVYNAIIGISTKAIIYLYYCLAVIAAIIFYLSTYRFDHFFWNSPIIFAQPTSAIAAIITLASMTAFTLRFLNVSEHQPYTAKALQSSIFIWAFIVIVILLAPQTNVTTFTVLFSIVVSATILVSCLRLINKCHPMASYLAVTWTILFTSNIVYCFSALHSLPENMGMFRSPLTGIAFVATLLSFALGKKMALEKEKTFAQQAEKRLKDHFLAKMNHEIRTPMNGVIGMSELLSQTKLSSKQEYLNNIIRSSSASLLSVINDALDFSEIEAGNMELENTKFSLRTLMENTVGMFHPKVEEKQIPLYCKIDPAIPDTITGDSTRLIQILIHLISNAFKFTETGYIAISINLDENDRTQLRFTIQDTGIGIIKKARERLFQPFTQLDPSTTRKYSGSGLGLSICKQLTALMGGTIGVNSEKGHGSQFWFTAKLSPVYDKLFEYDKELHLSYGKRRVIILWHNVNSHLLVKYFFDNNYFKVFHAESPESVTMHIDTHKQYDIAIIADTDTVNHADLELVMTEHPALHWGLYTNQAEFVTNIEGLHIRTLTRWGMMDELLTVFSNDSNLDSATLINSDEKKYQQPLNALIAEDNEVNQAIILGFMKKLGHTIVTAADGKEAIGTYKERHDRIDVILMDCEMPNVDGYEATISIRSYEREYGLERKPIIAFTSHAFAEQKDKCRASGMDGHLAKPVTFESLEKMLRQFS